MSTYSLIKSFTNCTIRTMSTACTGNIVNNQTLETISRNLAFPLLQESHKGEAGRIGIVGGSLEYTGAPYFAGIAGLKVGADLIHIFCTKEAAPVIKSYSPELIVHPVLNDAKAIDKIEPWLERLHVLVIGPGLGRDEGTLDTVRELINVCRTVKKPLVIDADGLFLISKNPDIIKDYPGVILTPNAIEYKRLFGEHECDGLNQNITKIFGAECIILKKGKIDEIFFGDNKAMCNVMGSARRCGGQGDLLAGSLAVFYYWALKCPDTELDIVSACYAACKLTKECNARAFKRLGRSMTTSDMIDEIVHVFNQHFECR